MDGDSQRQSTRVVVATTDDIRFKAGRRPGDEYRDLGIQEATNGRMRAEVMHLSARANPTGWHYHECEIQFL